MTDYCVANEIPHELCGKIVVANDDREIKFLEDLADRGNRNGLSGLRYITDTEIKTREPNVIAKKALLVSQEGIVYYKAVMKSLAQHIKNNGGDIILELKLLMQKIMQRKWF